MSVTLISVKKKNSDDFFQEVVTKITLIGNEINQALKSIIDANKRTQMLSITAKIEANRIGETGKDFLVVSNAIDELSTKINKVLDKLQLESIQGIDKLGLVIENKSVNLFGNRLANLALVNMRLSDRNLFERSADIRWWATDDILVNALTKNDNFIDAENRLKMILSSYSVYHDLILCDISGDGKARCVSNSNLTSTATNFYDRQWFQNALHTKDGTEYGFESAHASTNFDTPTITFSCKIHENGDPQRKVIGVLCAVFKWKDFSERLIEISSLTKEEKEKGRILFCDNDGNILADSKEKYLEKIDEFTGKQELFEKEKGFTVITKNNKVKLVSHALSPGFEGFKSTNWHSIIVQEIELASNEIKNIDCHVNNDSLDSISKLVVNLGDETQKAIKEINGVNDQTQILSLNAAIEAARVGDAGKGFGVISEFMGNISRQIADVTHVMRSKTQEKIKDLDDFLSINSRKIKGTRLVNLSSINIDLIDRSLFERSADVRWWATDHSVFNTLSDNNQANLDFLSNRLETILRYYTVYDDIVVYDNLGNIITNGSDSNILGDKVSDSDWFQNVQKTNNGKNYGFDVIKIQKDGRDSIHLVFSCKIHKNGDTSLETVGILATVFKWEHFTETIFSELPLSDEEKKHTSLVIMDVNGFSLASINTNDQITIDELTPFLKETKNFDNVTKNGFSGLIGNAASVGYEGFSTKWHVMIMQHTVSE